MQSQRLVSRLTAASQTNYTIVLGAVSCLLWIFSWGWGWGVLGRMFVILRWSSEAPAVKRPGSVPTQRDSSGGRTGPLTQVAPVMQTASRRSCCCSTSRYLKKSLTSVEWGFRATYKCGELFVIVCYTSKYLYTSGGFFNDAFDNSNKLNRNICKNNRRILPNQSEWVIGLLQRQCCWL